MDLVQPAAEVERHPVGQVAAVGEVHAHDPVARLEDAEVGGHVGLGARVRLDVDVLGAREEGEGALLGEPLGDVDVLAAAVVALAGQALGVLVGQPRALGLHHRRGDVVLAGDELDLVVLAAALAEHRLPQDRVDLARCDSSARPLRWRDRHGSPTPSCRCGAAPSRRRRARGIFPRTRRSPDDPTGCSTRMRSRRSRRRGRRRPRPDGCPRSRRWRRLMRDRGIALRPHAKTHKSVEFARRQVAAGAVGPDRRHVGEAEVFADAGFDDLFIAYPLIVRGPAGGAAAAARVALDAVGRRGLGRRARGARGGAGGAATSGPRAHRDRHRRVRGRACRPADAGALARHAADRGLAVAGRFTHGGHGYRGGGRAAAAGEDAADGLAVAAAAIAATAGIEPAVLSAGSTPTAAVRARRRDRGAARDLRLRRPTAGGHRRRRPPRTRR